MFVLSQSKLVEEKMQQLMNGYSAYAETEELIRLIERNVSKYDLDIILDQTDVGCWFIPNK
ncbi:hypothetical protein HNQ94_000518 [Salirhabdus euzebyi]|uniref:Uncharacterized protein n=1 Tax=Salirhabdus euzebyi TaxID=394506 RepID=A0A841PSZ1_9BACI|nr:hypothetical protein [Salirhabdus euzebyi]MBB6452097.1 hypothetical protein [Salirhabdus euzebyi]